MQIENENKKKQLAGEPFFEAIAEIAFWTAVWHLLRTEDESRGRHGWNRANHYRTSGVFSHGYREYRSRPSGCLPGRSSGGVIAPLGHLTQGVIDHTGSDLWQAGLMAAGIDLLIRRARWLLPMTGAAARSLPGQWQR
jgi:hypothetical protein